MSGRIKHPSGGLVRTNSRTNNIRFQKGIIAMTENKNFDMDEILDELSSQIEDMVEDAVEDHIQDFANAELVDMVGKMVQDALDNLTGNGCKFVLNDGTVIKTKERMRIFSPDKSKMLLLYGGLRVDGTSLMVQTGPGSNYEYIACYKTREEAIATLVRVSEAMEAGLTKFEL